MYVLMLELRGRGYRESNRGFSIPVESAALHFGAFWLEITANSAEIRGRSYYPFSGREAISADEARRLIIAANRAPSTAWFPRPPRNPINA